MAAKPQMSGNSMVSSSNTNHETGNPRLIIAGDYPDPSILRDGDDFYMTHSVFGYMPGFLIWRSKDLIHWDPIVRAMPRFRGSFAPDLAKVNGKYFIYFPEGRVNRVITADNICGPWSEPIKIDVNHIDPGHVVAEDGKRYLFTSDGYVTRSSDDGLKIEGKVDKVYDGSGETMDAGLVAVLEWMVTSGGRAVIA